MSIISLSPEQFARYKHQIALPGMSDEAQSRLLAGRIALLGMSEAATRAAQYLSEVGLGCIVLIDNELNRLIRVKRQVSAATTASSDTIIETRLWGLDAHHLETMLRDCHVVIDALDDWQYKLTASDTCMSLGKPLIHAGGTGFRFQVFTMVPGKSACLRCVFPEIGIDDVPLVPQVTASLAPVYSMIGALQAMEATKIIARVGVTQGNELWKFDWLSGELETIRGLDRRYDCPDCGRLAK